MTSDRDANHTNQIVGLASRGGHQRDVFRGLRRAFADMERVLGQRDQPHFDAAATIGGFVRLWGPYVRVEEEILLPAASACGVAEPLIEAARLRRDLVGELLKRARGGCLTLGLVEVLAGQVREIVEASEDEVIGLFAAVEEAGGATKSLRIRLDHAHAGATAAEGDDPSAEPAADRPSPIGAGNKHRRAMHVASPRSPA